MNDTIDRVKIFQEYFTKITTQSSPNDVIEVVKRQDEASKWLFDWLSTKITYWYLEWEIYSDYMLYCDTTDDQIDFVQVFLCIPDEQEAFFFRLTFGEFNL